MSHVFLHCNVPLTRRKCITPKKPSRPKPAEVRRCFPSWVQEVFHTVWDVSAPFADVTRYLDAPLLCLRTLKSDPIVGLPSTEAGIKLDTIDPKWRTNGKRGVIQFKANTAD